MDKFSFLVRVASTSGFSLVTRRDTDFQTLCRVNINMTLPELEELVAQADVGHEHSDGETASFTVGVICNFAPDDTGVVATIIDEHSIGDVLALMGDRPRKDVLFGTSRTSGSSGRKVAPRPGFPGGKRQEESLQKREQKAGPQAEPPRPVSGGRKDQGTKAVVLRGAVILTVVTKTAAMAIVSTGKRSNRLFLPRATKGPGHGIK